MSNQTELVNQNSRYDTVYYARSFSKKKKHAIHYMYSVLKNHTPGSLNNFNFLFLFHWGVSFCLCQIAGIDACYCFFCKRKTLIVKHLKFIYLLFKHGVWLNILLWNDMDLLRAVFSVILSSGLFREILSAGMFLRTELETPQRNTYSIITK